MKQKNIKLGLVTLFSAVALGTVAIQGNTNVDAAALGTPLQATMYDPTSAPEKFLNIWNTNGYALQPDSVTNVKVGTSDVVLHTDAGRSVGSVVTGLFDAPHYRWLVSHDGKNWSSLPEWKYGHRKNLPVDTGEEGTTWYQLDTQYYNYLTGWALKTHIYSNVAQVNILPNDVQPDSIKVSTDTDYIYNTQDKLMNVSYAHAVVNPANSTGKLSWSLDDNSSKYATIDSTTGKITAKDVSEEPSLDHRIKVVATYTGSDTDKTGAAPKVVTGSTYVAVGGGLNTVSSSVGQTATFNLQGNQNDYYGYWDDNDIWVEWYTKKVGDKDSQSQSLGSTKVPSYTTPILKDENANSLYRAKIIMRKDGKELTMKTGWAGLSLY